VGVIAGWLFSYASLQLELGRPIDVDWRSRLVLRAESVKRGVNPQPREWLAFLGIPPFVGNPGNCWTCDNGAVKLRASGVAVRLTQAGDVPLLGCGAILVFVNDVAPSVLAVRSAEQSKTSRTSGSAVGVARNESAMVAESVFRSVGFDRIRRGLDRIPQCDWLTLPAGERPRGYGGRGFPRWPIPSQGPCR